MSSNLEVFLGLCIFLGLIIPPAAPVLIPFGLILYALLKRGDQAMTEAVAAYNADGGSWASFWDVVVAIITFAAVGLAGASVLMWLSAGGVL